MSRQERKTVFDELGGAVESRWRHVNYDARAFSAIAVEALRRARIHAEITPEAVLEWVLSDDPLPAQFDPAGGFGEPPITVYSTSRFIIDVLFWNDGTTSIHEHGFSGAFQVMSGGSVHGVYTFAPDTIVTPQFKLGALKLQNIELLRKGDVRPIYGGSGLIHSLFHLDRPSTSIVVRTRSEPEHGGQFTYLPPGVGYEPSVRDDRSMRRLDALGALRNLDEARYFRRFAAHAGKLELPLFFLALMRHDRPTDHGKLKRSFAAARRRHGRAADRVVAAVEEEQRKAWILRLRRAAHDPAHRFFLAVMLNAPDRAAVKRLLRSRYPKKDPIRLICGWLAELAKLPPLPGMRYDNALDLPFTGKHVQRTLALALADRGLDALVRALAREFEGVGEQRKVLASLVEVVKQSPLLAAWWR